MDATNFITAHADAEEIDQRYLAAIAVLSYKPVVLGGLPGLKQIAQAQQRDGYDAVAIFHEASGTLIFANRGAEGLRSIEDWIEGAAAAVAKRFTGPLGHAIAFMESVFKRTSVQAGLQGVHWREIDEVCCTGHSWGGALAEAQVALGPSIAATLQIARTPTSGVGIASAGFAGAIRALAASRDVTIPADMHWKMQHYIRRRDPILAQPGHDLLGEWIPVPSIYRATFTPARRGYGVEYSVTPPAGENHSKERYFEHFGQSGDDHCYVTRRGKDLFLQGVRPARTEFGTVHPDTLIDRD